MRWDRLSFKSRRVKRSFLKKLLLLLGMLLTGLGLYRVLTSLFLVKTVTVVGKQGEILKGIEKIGGENLLFLNTKKWADRLEEENPIVKEIEVKKEFPTQIIINFKKREPRALIFDPNSNFSLLIDEEGIILRKEEREELPAIIANLQNFKIGDRIKDKTIDLALNIIAVLEEKASSSKFTLDESANVLKATLADGALILVNLEKDKEKTLYSLQRLQEKFKIEGNWPRKIDLRFEKPVLTF